MKPEGGHNSCENDDCPAKWGAFTMDMRNHQLVCRNCGTRQHRFNCGFYMCCKEFKTESEMNQHIKYEHPGPGKKAYFVDVLRKLR